MNPNRKPTVLVSCERTGAIRSRLRAQGINAYSLDIQPSTDNSSHHFQGDAMQLLYADRPPELERIDVHISHFPCTYFTVSQAWTYKKKVDGEWVVPHPDYPYRWEEREEALRFARAMVYCPIELGEDEGLPAFVGENPTPMKELTDVIGPYSQRIQPYMFGDNASKWTCLWLRGIKPIIPFPDHAWAIPEYFVEGASGKLLPRYANQTPSGQNKLGPSANRSDERAATYPGIADAITGQVVRHLRERE